MDTEKGIARLNMDKDELDALAARIYRESGHGLERDDPVMVQYLMHKIMLSQFLESQGQTMTAFADSLLPHILDTEERFEKKKTEFIEYLRNAKEESLRALHEKYSQTVNGSLDDIRRAVLAELEPLTRNMRVAENSMSRMLDEERGKFRETVERFEKTMWKIAYFVSGAFIVSGLGVIAWRIWG